MTPLEVLRQLRHTIFREEDHKTWFIPVCASCQEGLFAELTRLYPEQAGFIASRNFAIRGFLVGAGTKETCVVHSLLSVALTGIEELPPPA